VHVRDSDGSVIFSIAPALTGGSKKTVEFAIKYKKPWLLISRGDHSPEAMLLEFIREQRIRILNVAGPEPTRSQRFRGFCKASAGSGVLCWAELTGTVGRQI
jgi:hypothetical protein